MRNPRVVLDNLAMKGKNYIFKRLYRNLYNVEFYSLAYFNVFSENVDDKATRYIEELVTKMKKGVFHPSGVNRDVRTIKYKQELLVAEVLTMILRGVFGSSFSESSHGYKLDKSSHTALKHVQGTFRGARWIIKGDLKNCFSNFNNHQLMKILRSKIKDERFINLLWKFLNANYLKDWTFNETYSGIPNSNNLGTTLFDIYLSKLDEFIEQVKARYDEGERRRVNTEYKRLQSQLYKRRKKHKENWFELTDKEKKEALEYVKETRKKLQSMEYSDPMDNNYKRLQYVRHANEFLVGIIGSKADTVNLVSDITSFLNDLELNPNKVSFKNSRKRTRFLGYDVLVTRNKSRIRKTKSGITQRTLSMVCQLLVPHEVWRNRLIEYKAIKIDKNTNEWMSHHRSHLIHSDDLEILRTYNAEISSLYHYYKLANDSTALATFKYFMEYSMYKTFANKYKTSVAKIIKKHKVNGEFTIRYQTRRGVKSAHLYNKGFKRIKGLCRNHMKLDRLPNTHMYHSSRNSLMKKVFYHKCHYCDSDKQIEHHHVNKLKKNKNKQVWKRKKIERESKTIPVCRTCHLALHQGTLD